MNNTLNLRILLEYTLKGLHVAAVHLLEGGTNARNLLNTVNYVGIRVREIVNDYYLIACFLQFHGCMASNETRTTRYQNCLFHIMSY